MTTTYDLPMPGDKVDDRLVVASTWVRDDAEPILATVLLLNPSTPFYTVANLIWGTGSGWAIEASSEHLNIVPAVAEYEQQGGDY